ncbi:Receptor-type guanylate cyclase gcy [Seminavis robusta]|uniref:Receptor-type guanylate cyclase gcy n=1 Tax=Seminavis robusta TaxID=568900 RepID=A0A9N8HE38_9STRA|nr:Receptor-type guanylate cyclase gcy [Seminavis robusta]|eukprot:Sro494_g154240.1 Receptor-type guanylate cyclase gcy (1192) ;mRNA; f:21483-26526
MNLSTASSSKVTKADDDRSVDSLSNSNNSGDDDDESKPNHHHRDHSVAGESTCHDTTSGCSEDDGAMAIGKEESAQVFRLRLLVLLAILLAAVAVSLVVFFLTTNSEVDEFETQFEGASTKILTSFEEIVDRKLSAIGSLGLQASLFAASQPNQSWPCVTINDFQIRAAVTRELSGALFTRLIPVVVEETREKWETYAVQNFGWIKNAEAYNDENGLSFYKNRRRSLQDDGYAIGSNESGIDFSSGMGNKIYEFDETFTPAPVTGPGPYFPLWQEAPTNGRDISGFDTKAYPDYSPYIVKAWETAEMTIGGLDTAPPGNTTDNDISTSYFALLESGKAGKQVMYMGDPMSSVFFPVFDDFNSEDRVVVALILAVFKWAFYFQNLLPPHFAGLVLVLENNCDGAFTYKVVGENVEYLGEGDLHEDFSRRDDMVQTRDFGSTNNIGEDSALNVALNQDICSYKLSVYPAKELEDEYLTWLPLIVTLSVAMVFVLTAIVFLSFNHYVERRQTLVYDQAVKSTAIVSSLFPEAVRDRLMGNQYASGKTRLKAFMSGNEEDGIGQPIADLFPHCTVFFGDISGFTAWSSTRDPAHVFTLLETIYQAFDTIAKKRNVFKVETIGDSYVAVTGLPNPNDKHALVMTRFASACLAKFGDLTRMLEHSLGPDTCDLGLRIGLHSGPVTAGVLRGDRARFQLFGDTVNTAARMESSGKPNQIQVSKATADLLIELGKEHWVERRSDLVNVKGKGILDSFWLDVNGKSPSGASHSDGADLRFSAVSSDGSSALQMDARKEERLIRWMTDLFLKRMEAIVVRQDPDKVGKCDPSSLVYHVPEGKTSLDEVAEVIKMPHFDAKADARAKSRGNMKIPLDIVDQLHKVVTGLARMYKPNPFHNFEHACHTVMNVDKFLNRIVTPDVEEENLKSEGDQAGIAATVHSYTHGMTDPITLLAIVFSALVHDTDHRGVSNAQLAKEEETMAALYHNKSIAEQNSLDLAWDLLMLDEYSNLRAALFVDRAELMRFRQVVVNVVLATDIFDPELNGLRKGRWNRAFNGVQDENHNDLRATIVIEHIIQGSDVSHTMQHWHIYRKWNQRLFKEMWVAFKQGRMGKSPAEFWYKGELGFFDNYIIPLAKKLKECNVFGVSSDECLNYAMHNRREWEARGVEVTAEMIEEMEQMDFMPTPEKFQDEEYASQVDV